MLADSSVLPLDRLKSTWFWASATLLVGLSKPQDFQGHIWTHIELDLLLAASKAALVAYQRRMHPYSLHFHERSMP